MKVVVPSAARTANPFVDGGSDRRELISVWLSLDSNDSEIEHIVIARDVNNGRTGLKIDIRDADWLILRQFHFCQIDAEESAGDFDRCAKIFKRCLVNSQRTGSYGDVAGARDKRGNR